MLFQVLKISLIGHRKRILASLGDRLHEEPPQKPPRSITLRVSAITSVWLSSLLLKKYTVQRKWLKPRRRKCRLFSSWLALSISLLIVSGFLNK